MENHYNRCRENDSGLRQLYIGGAPLPMRRTARKVALMNNESTSTNRGFEPPSYLNTLIAALNDGAKAAQGGALLFLLVGLYLLATAFTVSDEDLLLGRTVTISQIGAALPISFSFVIAPMVFVLLHSYTLVRYDMLAANIRQFRREEQETVNLESDRQRCRQLLANVECVGALTTPRSAALYTNSGPGCSSAPSSCFRSPCCSWCKSTHYATRVI